MATHNTTTKRFLHRLFYGMLDNLHQVGLILCLILGFIGIGFGYFFWVDQQNKSAQRYFGLLIAEYNLSKEDKSADLPSLLSRFEKGYEKHSGCSLLPYYKSYAVNILLQQDKKEEALALLDTIVAATQASPLLPFYRMEHALISLDIADEQGQTKAKDTLIELAHDTSNMFKDSAQFYLGRYYWTHNNVELAREEWQALVDEQADKKVGHSPWVQQVKDYLQLIIV